MYHQTCAGRSSEFLDTQRLVVSLVILKRQSISDPVSIEVRPCHFDVLDGHFLAVSFSLAWGSAAMKCLFFNFLQLYVQYFTISLTSNVQYFTLRSVTVVQEHKDEGEKTGESTGQ